ncbi:MAG: hypothetical protein QMD05_03730 [Candidatus Brocadiaceae bacterium]|nr:hypothetical protein [Candidatus Brocadiaceae bacterium]
MSRELVPEMHDMLKLTKYKHDFSDFPTDRFKGLIPKTETWEGVIGHHLKEGFPAFPTTPSTFLLKIADSLASSFSRNKLKKSAKGVEEDYAEEDPADKHTVNTLWCSKEGEDKRLEKESPQIRALLEFYNSDPGAEEFFAKYDNILRTRAEDAHKGMNVTSLFTHCRLTGKFYRILQKNFAVEPKEIGTTIDAVGRILGDKTYSQWQLSIANCRFRFHQKPVRAKDLNIFLQLEETVGKIRCDFADNVLFSTPEELIFIYAKEEDLDRVLKMAADNGLWLELRVARRLLGQLSPDVSRLDKIGQNFYGVTDEQIEPPICEICQMRQGTKEWKEGEGPIEYLCPTCYDIRDKRAPLTKLRYWIDEGGEGLSLLWVKIKLDYDLLNRVLNKFYVDYLKGLGLSTTEATTRFSIISEFQEGYDAFLRDFSKRINNGFGGENVQRVLGDFYCIKAESTKDILEVLKIYKELLEGHFSKFLTLSIDSPLTLSIVLSPSKFPFFQCWRVIEDSEPDIHIALVGHGEITIKNKNLRELLLASETRYRKTALHKLAEVSRLSEALARLRFEDKSRDEDSQTYRQLRERLLPLGMGFRDILTFARILED